MTDDQECDEAEQYTSKFKPTDEQLTRWSKDCADALFNATEEELGDFEEC